jgi:hypothetical protein
MPCVLYWCESSSWLDLYGLDVIWYGISALRMFGLGDVKVQRLNPDEGRTAAAPRRLAVRNKEGFVGFEYAWISRLSFALW